MQLSYSWIVSGVWFLESQMRQSSSTIISRANQLIDILVDILIFLVSHECRQKTSLVSSYTIQQQPFISVRADHTSEIITRSPDLNPIKNPYCIAKIFYIDRNLDMDSGTRTIYHHRVNNGLNLNSTDT